MGNLNLFNFYLSSLFTMCYDPNGIKYGENMGKYGEFIIPNILLLLLSEHHYL